MVAPTRHEGFALQPDKELRTILFDEATVREAQDDDRGPVIVGYGAVYGSPSLDLGGFREFVAPGAFKKSLKSRDDIRSFFNHDPSKPLGSRDAGNLKLTEDDRGLAYEVEPPDTTYANDLMKAMKAGLVRGSSFTFRTIKDRWEEQDGVQTRTLLEARLFELGPVTQPAYPSANSQVRAMLEARGIALDDGEALDLEPVLRSIFGDLDIAALARYESDVVRAAISILEAKLPAVDDTDPEIPTDEWRQAAERRRRRLRLLELKFK